MCTTWAGLLYGEETHHIDHLAPLCQILDIPLLVTESSVQASIQKYYPECRSFRYNYLEIGYALTSQYETIFCCIPRETFDTIFFLPQQLLQKKIQTVWCPHGNSDKNNLHALTKESHALLYGPQMAHRLDQHGILPKLNYVVTGNYRHAFYLERRTFYDSLITKVVTPLLPPNCKTILYAPTWKDYENSSSFHKIRSLQPPPPGWNLIIKPHPNLFRQNPLNTFLLEMSHPHILYLPDFAPIYPLLQQADIYVGDRSSIGYDFLTFDRPLFLIDPLPGDPLAQVATLLNELDFSAIPSADDSLSTQRNQLLANSFAPLSSLEELKQQILQAFSPSLVK